MREDHLVFNNKFFILNNVYYVPNISRNIILISQLCDQLFTISFNNITIIIYCNGMEICSAYLKNGFYVLYSYEFFNFNIKMFRVVKLILSKRQKVSNDDEIYL